MTWKFLGHASFHLTTVAAVMLLSSCQKGASQGKAEFRMGEKMQVGPLIYNVLETKWTSQIGDMLHQRVPKQRFLLIKVSVTNSGGKETSVPFLTLEDAKSESFPEEQSGEGVDNWLGFLRTIQPAQTEEGWILFDVVPNSYSLRVAAEMADGDEQSLLIKIPFNIDSLADGLPKPTL